MNHLEKLRTLSKEIALLEGTSSLLHWDQETHMPEKAATHRGEQLKVLSGLIHQKKTSSTYRKALNQLIDLETGEILVKGISDEERAALVEWRRDYRIESALPKKFVEEFAKLTSDATVAWRAARTENSFSTFSPFLEKIVKMTRKRIDYLGYKENPYDAMIDLFEPQMTTKEIVKLFTPLREKVTTLLKQILAKPQVDDRFLFGNFDRDKQIAFSHKLLEAMHYDLTRGQLDFSAHPFSSATHPNDARITTRIHPTSLLSNISVILHEAGHALYEMGLPLAQFGTPLAAACSHGIHESQSRLWETRIGKSRPFWHHFLPELKKHFPQLDAITLDTFYQAINRVEPGFIRVEADEVTYSLHIILRFELELALLDGSLKVKNLPEAWNQKMNELFGITPPSNKEGCLQDIHWALGAFGYFPSYTLGNLYCAHLFEAYTEERPTWEKEITAGQLLPLKEWLGDKVHRFGRRYSSHELLQRAGGKPFTADAYIRYLTTKYH